MFLFTNSLFILFSRHGEPLHESTAQGGEGPLPWSCLPPCSATHLTSKVVGAPRAVLPARSAPWGSSPPPQADAPIQPSPIDGGACEPWLLWSERRHTSPCRWVYRTRTTPLLPHPQRRRVPAPAPPPIPPAPGQRCGRRRRPPLPPLRRPPLLRSCARRIGAPRGRCRIHPDPLHGHPHPAPRCHRPLARGGSGGGNGGGGSGGYAHFCWGRLAEGVTGNQVGGGHEPAIGGGTAPVAGALAGKSRWRHGCMMPRRHAESTSGGGHRHVRGHPGGRGVGLSTDCGGAAAAAGW